MKRLLLAMIGTCLLCTSAHALDRSSFSAKLGKYTAAGTTPRGLCVCKQSGIYYLKAGFLTSTPGTIGSGTLVGITVSCAVPLFYADGGVSQLGSCNSFEVLGK